MDPLDINVDSTPGAEYSTDFTGSSTKLPPRHIILSTSQPVCETNAKTSCLSNRGVKPQSFHTQPAVRTLPYPILSCQHCVLTFSCKASLERHVLRRHLPSPVHRCSACYFRHPLASEVRRHWAQSHAPREQAPLDLPCALCSKKFTSRPLLERHVQGAHGPQLCCVLCTAVCLGVAELQAHYAAKHRRGAWLSHQIHLAKDLTEQLLCIKLPLKCFYCQKGFNEKKVLKTHILVSHFGIKYFMCNTCTYVSKRKGGIMDHFLARHADCKQGYSSLDQCVELPWNSAALQGSAGLFEEPLPHTSVERLVQHEMRNHLAEAHGVQENSQEKISCTGHFICHSGVKEHFTSEHLSALLCNICKSDVVQRMLETEESLEKALADLTVYESVQEMHKINQIKPNPHFKCLYCSKFLTSKIKTWHHVLFEHKFNMRYQCMICAKKFYYLSYVIAHFTSEHPATAIDYATISPVPEDIMGTEISHGTLEENLVVKNSPYECPACKAALVTRSDVRKHMPVCIRNVFSCLNCQFVANTAEDIRAHSDAQHVRTGSCTISQENATNPQRAIVVSRKDSHTNMETIKGLRNESAEKCSLKCPYCTIYILNHSDFREHLRTCILQCTLCSFRCANSRVLLVHMRSAHQAAGTSQPITCQVCSKAFPSPEPYLSHLDSGVCSLPLLQCLGCGFFSNDTNIFSEHFKHHVVSEDIYIKYLRKPATAPHAPQVSLVDSASNTYTVTKAKSQHKVYGKSRVASKTSLASNVSGNTEPKTYVNTLQGMSKVPQPPVVLKITPNLLSDIEQVVETPNSLSAQNITVLRVPEIVGCKSEASLAIKTEHPDVDMVSLPEFVDCTPITHSKLAIKTEPMDDSEPNSQTFNIANTPVNLPDLNPRLNTEHIFDPEIKQ